MGDAVCVVIPARLDSSRLRRKALALLAGIPLIEHVRLRAIEANVGPVIVATDSTEIEHVVRSFGGQVVRTGPASNGTLRVAQAIRGSSAEIVLNVQGDQPLLDPEHVVALATRMQSAFIGTLVTRYRENPQDPSIVKALLDGDQAVDFLRIPTTAPHWRHLGLYGFTRAALDQVTELPVSARARAVGLEQLTWLDAGLPIHVATVEVAAPAVDTPAQLDQIREQLSARG